METDEEDFEKTRKFIEELAAQEAVKYVKDNMLVGMGSGSTVKYFIEALGIEVAKGLKVTVVPTSRETEELCKVAEITLNLIKGGGDLLWEKIIASVSEREIIIVDSRKQLLTCCRALPMILKLPELH